MRLAFDVQVSDKEIGRLARLGHVIVCVARPSETDESWVARAISLGAERIYSDDHDIGDILQRIGSGIRRIQTGATTFMVKPCID